MRQILSFLFISVTFFASGQLTEQLKSPPYYIKTASIDNFQRPFYSNIIELNRTFQLSFDDLQADEKDYYYKILRFDEHWKPTALQVSEYIDGYDSDIITDMKQSTGTLQSYMHYSVSFPNENTRILLSGNYIIQILNDNDEIIFSKAVVLYEKKIETGIQVRWPDDVSVSREKQQIDLYLYPGSFNIQNESSNLTLILIQNKKWQEVKTFHSPTYYQGSKWIYRDSKKALFDGLNEYRRFETKDLRGTNYNIVKRERIENLYDFYVYPDTPRLRYLFYEDADGCYYINSVQAEDDTHTEADYVYVHFNFNAAVDEKEKIYVTGDFNNYQTNENNRLKYNPDTGFYEAVLLLKQGYYEYLYQTEKNGKFSFVPIEGNFSETENTYELIVYYHAPGKRYTEVIGYGKATSLQMK